MPSTPLNCWEMQGCGREPGGTHARLHGVCPATRPGAYDGINDGRHGGRYCWRVAGTFCGGEVQGTFAEKVSDCGQCEFFLKVLKEEGKQFRT